jgi:peptide chain release factor 2
VSKGLEDLASTIELIEEEPDEELLNEAAAQLSEIQQAITQLRMGLLFDAPEDQASAIVDINAGAGGTESCDWAAMLYRMISMWADQHEYKVSILSEAPGDEAGVKNITLEIEGDRVYGQLKNENGVHRLVRISPFDSNKRRHTSFASMYVYPDIDDEIVIEIKSDDLRVDTYRASGAGGQHINKTDSAVRLTHLPTNTVVQCQNERSQHKNRDKAMKMLKAKLYDIEQQKRDAEKAKTENQKSAIAWGSQIRSYVLHPYRMVKDHRSNHESSNADAVLDGDIDAFIFARLKQVAQSKSGKR